MSWHTHALEEDDGSKIGGKLNVTIKSYEW